MSNNEVRARGHRGHAGHNASKNDSSTDSDASDTQLTPEELAIKKKVVVVKKKKKGEMLRRTVVSFQLFALFFFLVYLGHFYMFLTVLITQAFLFRELINIRYRQTKELALPWFRTFHWCCFWSAAFWAHGQNTLVFLIEQGEEKFFLTKSMVSLAETLLEEFKFITFTLYATNLIFFVLSLKKRFYKYQMQQLGWTVFVLMLIVIQLSAISDNLFEGFYWFWLPASLVVCNDTFAYFSGKLFGRRFIKRKFLSVSPNKTWEGFIGALFCTIIWSQLFSALLSRWKYMICPVTDLDCEIPEYFIDREYTVRLPSVLVQLLGQTPDAAAAAENAWVAMSDFQVVQKPIQLHAFVLALFASLVAPFGGFFASAIKRAFSIKDFDSIIPGHGGLMDRLDCQLIMAMYTRVHYITWVRAFAVTVPTLMRSFMKLPRERQEEVFTQIQAVLQQNPTGAP